MSSIDEAISIARRVGDLLRMEGVPVKQLFLFGSHAKGMQHEWSDIDIAVVHDPFLGSTGKEKSLLFDRGKTVNVRVELVSFRPEDFANRYSALAQEIQHSGLPIEGSG